MDLWVQCSGMVIEMKSVSMVEFGYSFFPEKAKLSISGQIGIRRTTQQENKGMFGSISARQSKKENGDNGRLSAILIKFNAGKKLSSEELAYLRQKQPETYMKVQQILMEREMLERRMKAAKTKEQTAAAYMSSVGSISISSGSGESFGDTMNAARINQMSDAHRLYVATKEYQAKEDQSDIAKRERLKQEEMLGKMDEQQAKLEETMEKQKLIMEELSTVQEEQVSETEENKVEKAKDILEEVERLKKASRRKRKKITARRKNSSNSSSVTFHFNPLSKAEMREKLRELYWKREGMKHSDSKYSGTLTSATDRSMKTADIDSSIRSGSVNGTGSTAGTGVSADISSTICIGSSIDISL